MPQLASKPFKKGNYYYFKGSVDGVRKTIPTRCTEEADAYVFINNWLEGLDKKELTSLGSILALWTHPDLNPKKLYFQASGRCYSDRYAKHTAFYLGELIKVAKKLPSIYNQDIHKLTRAQCKQLFDKVVLVYGVTYKSRAIVKAFKTVTSWMYETGEIETNPADRLLNVKPKSKPRDAIAAEDLSILLDKPEIWPTSELFDFFSFVALTGLRLGEAACLDQSLQITEDRGMVVLKVHRAYKDEAWKTIGTPKWDKLRDIPLCKRAQEILKRRPKTGLAFPSLSKQKIEQAFHTARELALDEDWEYPEAIRIMSPHILRHSLNTNLLDAGCGKIMVGEYLSWTHQEDVQSGYTHFRAKHLQKIADKIDEIYSGKVVDFSITGLHTV